jgi:hypothetical protein
MESPNPDHPARSETRDAQRQLTWATLLARWTDFARAAVALPAEGEPGRWRAAVAPIIGLQALTFALAEADQLSPDERAVALDRGAILIRRYAADLEKAWAGVPLPGEVVALLEDARGALRAVFRVPPAASGSTAVDEPGL